MFRSVRVTTLVTAFALVAATGLSLAAASSDCEASVDSELIREEEHEAGTHYTWRVDVQTDEDCATVEFNLILTIQKSDQENETVVREGRVRLSNGSIEHQMRYEMKPDDNLVKWEVVKSSCELCVLDRLE